MAQVAVNGSAFGGASLIDKDNNPTTGTFSSISKMKKRKKRQKQQPLVMALAVPLILQLLLQFGAIPKVTCFFIDSRQSPRANDWSYAEQHEWGARFKDCSQRAQSPIDIQHKNVIISQHLRLHFYNYNQQLKFKLSNAHHTIKMNPVMAGSEQLDSSGGSQDAAFNASAPSLHDIITADEYVEIMPGQQQLSQAASSEESIKSQELNKLPNGRLRVISNQQQQQMSENKSETNNGTINKNTAAAGGPRSRISALKNTLNSNNQNNKDQNRNQFEGNLNEQQDEQLEKLPYRGAPTIKLDWLDDGNNEFKLRDIHFHWGERRDNGSEHAIDGRRAAMEMHLVHIKHGLDKSAISFTSDSVTVIAVLIESHRKSNADFNPIVNELVRINATEESQEIEYKSIYDLLPSNLDSFYTYSGSLTTPPCYQVVNWIVMAERLNMNAKQIEMFRNLYAPEHQTGQHGLESASQRQSPNNDHNNDRNNNHLESETTDHRHHSPAPSPLEGHDNDDDDESSSQLKLIVPNVRSLLPLNNRTILASFNKYGSRIEAAWSSARSVVAPETVQLMFSTLISSLILLSYTLVNVRWLRSGGSM